MFHIISREYRLLEHVSIPWIDSFTDALGQLTHPAHIFKVKVKLYIYICVCVCVRVFIKV